MIGTPFHFTEQEFTLHERMCTLLAREFSHLKISPEASSINGLECNGKPLQEVLALLNQRFLQVISISAQIVEDSANFLELSAKLAQVKIETPPAKKYSSRRSKYRKAAADKPTPVAKILTADEQKRSFCDSLHANLYLCQSFCSYIFQTLYDHKDAATTKNTKAFHQLNSYFLLLSCILNYNMLAYQTHPIYKEVNIDRINSLLAASKNWTVLLESFHLDYGQSADFTDLRILFVKRMISFKQKICQNPKFVGLWTDEMLLPFSIEELNYHLTQKNERALRLGVPFHGNAVISDANTLYNASYGSEKKLFEQFLATCLSEPNPCKRAQFLFYYNEANGNVDVFDVKQNPDTRYLEIINIHTGNSCAHYNLLLRIYTLLTMFKVDFKILACQAELGHRTQSTSLYAFKISSLLAKSTFTEIESKCTPQQPKFIDEAHKSPQQLPLIGQQVHWFPIETLGDKAVLLISSLKKRKALLKERFASYQQQYGLSEMVQDDPATVYNYADDYRKRLAHRYHRQNPFANLSDQCLKQKLTTEDNGQMVRRAAAGFANTREFEFLVELMKKNDQEKVLHVPAKEKDYTPLHWTLKKQSAKKAAILLHATPFTQAELSEKNKDNKSAMDYFAASKNPLVKENLVLQRLLRK